MLSTGPNPSPTLYTRSTSPAASQAGLFEARDVVAWWVAGLGDLRQDVGSELNARRGDAAKVIQPKVNIAQLQQPAPRKLV